MCVSHTEVPPTSARNSIIEAGLLQYPLMKTKIAPIFTSSLGSCPTALASLYAVSLEIGSIVHEEAFGLAVCFRRDQHRVEQLTTSRPLLGQVGRLSAAAGEQ